MDGGVGAHSSSVVALSKLCPCVCSLVLDTNRVQSSDSRVCDMYSIGRDDGELHLEMST